MLRLALQLGWSVRELETRMDAAELAEWVAYDAIEGLPQPWRQAGVVAAAVTNPWRAKGTRALRPDDFMPITRPPREQSDAQIYRLLAAAWGGPPPAG